VGNIEYGPWKAVPPCHYVLTDATGATIVVEYVGGTLNIYDNPLGVVTNAPGFDWHMTNLRNYIGISPTAREGVRLDGVSLDPLSTGGNLFGMPGDFSSPSRFVRATVFAQTSVQPATGPDAVMQGFHILDNFDIPDGSVPEPSGGGDPYEITEWTTMSNLTARTFYIWTSDNRAIRTLDLTAVDLDGSEIQTFPLDQEQTFVDLGAA
jgi:choloylglycine hydrolase